MKILKWVSLPFLALLLCSSANTHKNDTQLFRYVDKIVRLVEWNNENTSDFFEIGFIGDHHLFKLSKIYFRGKTYHDKPIKVINYHSKEEISSHPPRMLYIGKNKHEEISNYGDLCSMEHIFSIADDQKENADSPLIVLHVNPAEEIEMIVNKTEAEKQSFKLSYHLLRAAKVVK